MPILISILSKKYVLIILLWTFFAFELKSENNYYFDSINKSILKGKNSNDYKINKLLACVDSNYRTNVNESWIFLRTADSLSKLVKDSKTNLKVKLFQAKLSEFMYKYDQAYLTLNSIKDRVYQSNNAALILEYNFRQANLFLRYGNDSLANIYVDEAIIYSDPDKNISMFNEVCNLKIRTSKKNLDSPDLLNLLNKSYIASLKSKDPYIIGRAISNFTYRYFDAQKYQEALDIVNEKSTPSLTKSYRFQMTIANSKAFAFLMLKQYDSALIEAYIALNARIKSGDSILVSSSLINLSEVYIEIDSLEKAKYILFRALDIAKTVKNYSYIAKIYKYLANIHTKLNEINEANQALVNERVALDSINSDKALQSLSNLQFANALEVEKRKQDENSFKQFKIFAVIIIIMLLIIMVIIAINSRKRKADYKKLQKLIEERESAQAEVISMNHKLKQVNENLESIINSRTLELADMLAREHNANESKSKLMALISHEFRTPLTNITSSAELISIILKNDNKALFYKCPHYASIILDNSHQIVKMLDGIKKLNDTQLNVFQYKLEPINLLDSIQVYINKSTNKDVLIQRINLKAVHSEIYINAKQEIMDIIFEEIFKNSIQYSEENTEITIVSELNENQLVNLIIQDIGESISKDESEKVFEPYKRGKNVEFKNLHRGLGIGLSLTQICVEALKGEVKIDSDYQVGTKIIIVLPALVY